MKREELDFEYLCAKMTDMSGLPTRIYDGGSLSAVFSVAPMPADPAGRYLDGFLAREDHVSYFTAGNMDYYGILRSGAKTIVIGPSRSQPYTDREMRDLAFELGVPGRDWDPFVLFLRSIVPMPLGSVLQMMCSYNYILNGEKLNLSDFRDESGAFGEIVYATAESATSDIYKGYHMERRISEIVRNGDLPALGEWVKSAPTLRTGVLAPNQLRHEKDEFIMTASRVCGSAVEGELEVEEAYRLRDSYVQRCENAGDVTALMRLQFEMVREFTSQVAMLKEHTDGSVLVRDVYRYVRNHLSEPVRTADIAAALFLSRSRLSTAFREQTGITLNDYVHRVKIGEAKELLADRTKSVSLISDYLGYSSPSHFVRAFRKYTGRTPLSYRKDLRPAE